MPFRMHRPLFSPCLFVLPVEEPKVQLVGHNDVVDGVEEPTPAQEAAEYSEPSASLRPQYQKYESFRDESPPRGVSSTTRRHVILSRVYADVV
jgi:hypothetical protein